MKTANQRKMKRIIRGNTTFVTDLSPFGDTLKEIFNIASQIPPEHLTPRTTTDSWIVLVILTLCALIVGFARVREKQIFLYLFQGVFFVRSLDDLEKEEYKSHSSGSLLFILLFFTITAGTIYWMVFVQFPLGEWDRRMLSVFAPSVYFIYQLIMTTGAARLSGNAEAVKELNYFSIILTQFFGLIFLVEFFISYFQPEYMSKSVWVMGITYLCYLIVRFLRGFWIAINQGVPWYYIILYLWTLEILPLLIAVRVLYYDEFQRWMDTFV